MITYLINHQSHIQEACSSLSVKLHDEHLTEFAKVILYKVARKLGWSKTGYLPLPLFLRMFGQNGPLAKRIVKKDLKEYIRLQKRQHEYVLSLTDKGPYGVGHQR
mgnify:CR=1 FL=1